MALTTGATIVFERELRGAKVAACETGGTDATPCIHLSPVQVLQDEHRMKRLKAAFCPGIFSYANEEVASQILDDAFKICGGSAETLSEVIQTKFFAGYTPFHWLITKRHSKSGVPPLLLRLLLVLETLSAETQWEIEDACYREYDSDLYTAVKPKLTANAHAMPDPFSKSGFFTSDEDRPVVTHSGTNGDSSFRIPRFFDRMMVDEEVSIVFLYGDRQWRLTAAVVKPAHAGDPFSWGFSVVEIGARRSTVTKAQTAARRQRALMHVDMRYWVGSGFGRSESSCRVFSTGIFDYQAARRPQHFISNDEAFSQFYSDSFTLGPNREVRGQIIVEKY